MRHGTHPVDQLLPGDRLADGWVVTDVVGDGDSCFVSVQLGDELKTYRMPRKLMVEVNK